MNECKGMETLMTFILLQDVERKSFKEIRKYLSVKISTNAEWTVKRLRNLEISECSSSDLARTRTHFF